MNFRNLWCLTLYRTRKSACTAAHSKEFLFIFNVGTFCVFFFFIFLCFFNWIVCIEPVCMNCHLKRRPDIRWVWWLMTCWLSPRLHLLYMTVWADSWHWHLFFGVSTSGLCFFRQQGLCSDVSVWVTFFLSTFQAFLLIYIPLSLLLEKSAFPR